MDWTGDKWSVFLRKSMRNGNVCELEKEKDTEDRGRDPETHR